MTSVIGPQPHVQIDEETLLRFYKAHFGPENTQSFSGTFFKVHAASPSQIPEGVHLTDSEINVDESLGYYADGTQRTLTDEQIAIFRHSEIQGLLRERRLAQERLEQTSFSDEEANADAGSVDTGLVTEVKPSDVADGSADEMSESESLYEAFLLQERDQFREQQSKSRGLKSDTVLEYGDSSANFNEAPLAEMPRFHGRKIISYEDTAADVIVEAKEKRFLWPKIG